MDNENKSKIICSNCGGQLKIDELQEFTECPYCGTRYAVADLLNESEAVRLEKMKARDEAKKQKAMKKNQKSAKKKKKSQLLKKGFSANC